MTFSEGLALDMVKGTFISLTLSLNLSGPKGNGDRSKPSFQCRLIAFSGFLILFLIARIWLGFITTRVPEPYLDEVFHVPQAQKYCDGKWFDWDDKITTPPGLYAISVLHLKIWRIAECSAFSLRGLNNLAIIQTFLLASTCRSLIERHHTKSCDGASSQSFSFYAYHTAFNITLFPVMFFVSSLYYTDVVSTLLVLVSYQNHLTRTSYDQPPLWNDLWTILLGVFTLTMRQTNIFWVVVYMGGMEIVHAVKMLKPAIIPTPRFTTLPELLRFYGWRYSLGDVHDPPLGLAWADDWILSLLSVAIAALCNPGRVLRQVWPHIATSGLFVNFVLWNGGVVLGDKSNHIATLHLAQMVYIWPLFVFFSAPLFSSHIVSIVGFTRDVIFNSQAAQHRDPPPMPVDSWTTVGGSSRRTPVDKNRPIKVPSPSRPYQLERSWVLRKVDDVFKNKIYYPLYLVCCLLSTFLIVKYNTIIHPFTLADNRHYMFYVFRYTILRSRWMRFSLVPIYAFFSRVCWQLLFGCNPGPMGVSTEECATERSWRKQAEYLNTPFAGYRMHDLERETKRRDRKDVNTFPHNGAVILGTLDEPNSTSTYAPSTSTAILWLIATTMSLMTAPLVEPRYFILPWVFWRLLVPAWPTHDCVLPLRTDARLDRIPRLGWLFRIGKKFDLRLVLETVWFLAINAVTMYMFLYRPFHWKAADGTLMDEGRLQRFMW